MTMTTRPDYGHGSACLCDACSWRQVQEISADFARSLREQAGITVQARSHMDRANLLYRIYWVVQDGREIQGYCTPEEAETFANELAMDLLEQGLIGEAEPA